MSTRIKLSFAPAAAPHPAFGHLLPVAKCNGEKGNIRTTAQAANGFPFSPRHFWRGEKVAEGRMRGSRES